MLYYRYNNVLKLRCNRRLKRLTTLGGKKQIVREYIVQGLALR